MIAGPVLLLTLLLVSAIGLYFLRKLEALAAILAAAVAGLLAVVVWRSPLGTPTSLAGRSILVGQPVRLQDLSLQITPASQALLVFLLVTAVATFVLAWRTYQGRTFYPFGLALLALWSTAALMQPLTLAPFVLALSGILAVFLIQAGKVGETRGAWRQMLFPTLSVPMFLLAAWYIDQAPLNPDDLTPYRIAGWLLIAGFVLLLQPAPFHVATPAVAGQAPPVVAAFLWIGGQSTVLFLLQRFLVTYPWLTSAVDSASWLLWLGIFTALVGGALASMQDTLGRYMGYAAVYDYGVMLVAMALRGTAGVPVAIWLLLTRTVALLTLATGAAIVKHHMATDRLSELAGASSRLPWSVAALIMGGFALAGMPLTVQFASRWALLELVAENDVRWSLFLYIGAIGALVGAVRVGRACFGKLSASPVERESFGLAALCAILVGAGLLLGLLPQLLTGPVAAVILPLSRLGP
jgi:formate hydrogenlyase subunit 3/multisubunit Na+/H+ antiporter MnhD subunit